MARDHYRPRHGDEEAARRRRETEDRLLEQEERRKKEGELVQTRKQRDEEIRQRAEKEAKDLNDFLQDQIARARQLADQARELQNRPRDDRR